RFRGGERERAARSDRHDPIVGLDQIAVAREKKHGAFVEDDEHGLETAEDAVGAPVFGELDGGALEVPAELFELRLEAREQRERIGGGAGKARENPVVVEAADLLRALFDDYLSEGDLAVAGEDGVVAVPHGKDRRAV